MIIMMKNLDVYSIFQNGCDVDKLTIELRLYSKVKAQDTELSERWNVSGFRVLLSEVIQYALLCGRRPPVYFYPWNLNIYLFKHMRQRGDLEILLCLYLEQHQRRHCPASQTPLCSHTHTALIKQSNPAPVTVNYSNHWSHIHMKWIGVKVGVTKGFAEEQYTLATQRLCT